MVLTTGTRVLSSFTSESITIKSEHNFLVKRRLSLRRNSIKFSPDKILTPTRRFLSLTVFFATPQCFRWIPRLAFSIARGQPCFRYYPTLLFLWEWAIVWGRRPSLGENAMVWKRKGRVRGGRKFLTLARVVKWLSETNSHFNFIYWVKPVWLLY